MRLITIGAFARAAGLTPKALRHYDECGLLTPAAVDPESGYRYYDPAQLETARLIAELRRVGVPLATIRTICALDAPAAAEAIAEYWQRVTVENAARARVAALLVEHLSGRATMSVTFNYATAADAGARDTTEDAVHAGDRLLAVADGVRGPGGAAASAAAIDAVTTLELTDAPAAELLTMLAGAVAEADRAVRAAATGDARPATTLTALLRSGTQLALLHIGDTRAYLVRGGELFRLTADHTWVQSQVDRGALSPAEAGAHPDRALLVRALGAGEPPVEADLALRTAVPGDRYLLCSDGLWAVVAQAEITAVLTAGDDPARAVERLVGLVRAAGAPDNVVCVVADVVDAG
ncbi:MerR family transcriptional regulator [Cryptosporangium aurantiacum]|uniref:Serine/threonine protein phosphatase PrpC n=1 Tax=Cryptosporangium aurantiacum TaxID=134849 RepID=A0A1M7RKX1_9ACTN|nr:MerR family transcriptional regulator [Cryptosporangium aurantiacum]SHN46963.1 Serine/threonine protein phosphatase PrpC [Cryptosporangium aurantiacum]